MLLIPRILDLIISSNDFCKSYIVVFDYLEFEKMTDIKRKDQILKIAAKQGFINASDLEQKGMSRNYLHVLHKEERLIKLDKGLYAYPDFPYTEHMDIIGICKRYPSVVICLISALNSSFPEHL